MFLIKLNLHTLTFKSLDNQVLCVPVDIFCYVNKRS